MSTDTMTWNAKAVPPGPHIWFSQTTREPQVWIVSVRRLADGPVETMTPQQFYQLIPELANENDPYNTRQVLERLAFNHGAERATGAVVPNEAIVRQLLRLAGAWQERIMQLDGRRDEPLDPGDVLDQARLELLSLTDELANG